MPVLPVSLFEPIWAQFSVLLPSHPPVSPTHSLGCHLHRIPDRIVFDHIVCALVHGSGYERIATPGCSDRTIRWRLHAWAEWGLAIKLHTLVLQQYDRTRWRAIAGHGGTCATTGVGFWPEPGYGEQAVPFGCVQGRLPISHWSA